MQTREIKNRQHSVANTRQMTKAMEMVSAAKMRKAQRIAFAARPYAKKAIDILSRLQNATKIKNVFLAGRPHSSHVLLLVVLSDKGLIGGFNANVVRETLQFARIYQEQNNDVAIVLVGEKGRMAFQRAGLSIIQSYKGAGDFVGLAEVREIGSFLQEYFAKQDVREVVAVYTEFLSTLKQKVVSRPVLPLSMRILENLIESVTPETGKFSNEKISPPTTTHTTEYLYEPAADELFAKLIPSLLDIYIYHVILESNASEHSARMIAMKNASDNAEDLLHELTLFYNKARQAAITREINEISAGVEALK